MAANLLALAFVVIGIPWLVGLSFLDAFVIIPFASMPAFFVAGMSGRGAPARTGLTGWLAGAGVLAASLAALNAMHWHGTALLPPWQIVLAALGLSLAVCLATAAAGEFIPGRTLRLGLMALVLFALFGYRALPPAWVAPLEADLSDSGIARKAWILAGGLMTVAAVLLRRASNRRGAR